MSVPDLAPDDDDDDDDDVWVWGANERVQTTMG